MHFVKFALTSLHGYSCVRLHVMQILMFYSARFHAILSIRQYKW